MQDICKDIEKTKRKLIRQGLRENFGQKDIARIREKYPMEYLPTKYVQVLVDFIEWCETADINTLRRTMLRLKTARQETLIINNVVKACKDIEKLNGTGYGFIYLASGFIARYNIHGFKDYYVGGGLADEILLYQGSNQWDNFRPGERDYEYNMQKKRIYNAICDRITNGMLAFMKVGA